MQIIVELSDLWMSMISTEAEGLLFLSWKAWTAFKPKYQKFCNRWLKIEVENVQGRSCYLKESTCSEGARLGLLLMQKRSSCFAVGAGGLAELSAVTETLWLAPWGVSLCLAALQHARNADGAEFLLGHPARAPACQVFLEGAPFLFLPTLRFPPRNSVGYNLYLQLKRS